MRRKFAFSVDEFYHIYNRGTDKRVIFTDIYDHNRFALLLHLCNSATQVDISNKLREGQSFAELINIDVSDRLVDIGAYCLMPNHFHLIVREKQAGGISRFMKKLLTAYSMYFNKKHKRTGSLFEGPFKARHADTDEYLKYLFAYIHLNPVKMIDPEWKEDGVVDRAKAKEFLAEYGFSSYLDYISDRKREEGLILNKQAFPEYFLASKDFEEFIKEWLNYQNNTLT